MYCRVWRWPDLQNHHELRAVPACQFTFNSKQKDVCINPYHYERVIVESPMLPSIMVPQSQPGQPHNQPQPGPSSMMHGNPMYPSTQPSYDYNYQHQMVMGSSPLGSPETSGFVNSPPPPPPMPNGPMASPCGGPETPPPAYSPAEEPKFQPNPLGLGAPALSEPMHVIQETAMDTSGNNNNENQVDNSIRPIEYMEPQFWCSIAYYELNSRVGEIYHARAPDIYVDGFTNPLMQNNNCFCLGQMSNVNRNSTIENTRRHIGKGNKNLTNILIAFASLNVHFRCSSSIC